MSAFCASANITNSKRQVRSYSESRHSLVQSACPFSAKSGHARLRLTDIGGVMRPLRNGVANGARTTSCRFSCQTLPQGRTAMSAARIVLLHYHLSSNLNHSTSGNMEVIARVLCGAREENEQTILPDGNSRLWRGA